MNREVEDQGLYIQEQDEESVLNWNSKAGEAIELEKSPQSSEEVITSLFCDIRSVISPL